MKKQIEEFRKKNCFCDDLDIDFCSKCDQPIPAQKPCMYCVFCIELIKFMEGR